MPFHDDHDQTTNHTDQLCPECCAEMDEARVENEKLGGEIAADIVDKYQRAMEADDSEKDEGQKLWDEMVDITYNLDDKEYASDVIMGLAGIASFEKML
jgi:hypothetical protein